MAILRGTPSPRTTKIKILTPLKFEICGYKETNRYEPPPLPQSACAPVRAGPFTAHSITTYLYPYSLLCHLLLTPQHSCYSTIPVFPIPSNHSLSFSFYFSQPPIKLFLSDFMFRFTSNLKQVLSTSSFISLIWVQVDVGVKVKFTLEQAMKARKGSKNIALLFL